jgi:hypothetical protein
MSKEDTNLEKDIKDTLAVTVPLVQDKLNRKNDVLTKESLNEFITSIQKVTYPPKPMQKIFELGSLPGIEASAFIPESRVYGSNTSSMDTMLAEAAESHKKFLNQAMLQPFDGTVTASRIDAIQFNEMDVETVINRTGNQDILKLLAKKMGRTIKNQDMKRILDYIYRNSMTIFSEKEDNRFDQDLNPDNFMDLMKADLDKLPGVKATILSNDYPETASIIVKVDHKALDETEMELISTDIYTTIRKYKVKGLDELEVIYHNKEVY